MLIGAEAAIELARQLLRLHLDHSLELWRGELGAAENLD